jgi:hypothetical protein
MKPMMKRILASLLLSCFAAGASAGCSDIPVKFFGVAIGPIPADYDKKLAWGIRQEGRVEVIKDVGFLILAGSNNDFDWSPLMAFFGSSGFEAVIAQGAMSGEKDQGFDKLAARVAEVVGTPARVEDGKASFACEEGLEARIEPVATKNGPQLKLTVRNPAASARTRAYINEYCGDPKRRQPKDICP